MLFFYAYFQLFLVVLFVGLTPADASILGSLSDIWGGVTSNIACNFVGSECPTPTADSSAIIGPTPTPPHVVVVSTNTPGTISLSVKPKPASTSSLIVTRTSILLVTSTQRYSSTEKSTIQPETTSIASLFNKAPSTFSTITTASSQISDTSLLGSAEVQKSPKTSAGAIIGAVIGTLAGMALLCTGIWFFVRQRNLRILKERESEGKNISF